MWPGFGRLLVPWASSLSTIDGGYFGRKVGGEEVRRLVSLQAQRRIRLRGTMIRIGRWAACLSGWMSGSFETVRHTATVGVALSRHDWRPERQFLFLEDGLTVNRVFSVHYNLEADYQSRGRFVASNPVAVTRSFFTLRLATRKPRCF